MFLVVTQATAVKGRNQGPACTAQSNCAMRTSPPFYHTWQSRWRGFCRCCYCCCFPQCEGPEFSRNTATGRWRGCHNVFCLALFQELFTALENLITDRMMPVRQPTFVTSRLTRAASPRGSSHAPSAHTHPGDLPSYRTDSDSCRPEAGPGACTASPRAVTAEQRRGQNACYCELHWLPLLCVTVRALS